MRLFLWKLQHERLTAVVAVGVHRKVLVVAVRTVVMFILARAVASMMLGSVGAVAVMISERIGVLR